MDIKKSKIDIEKIRKQIVLAQHQGYSGSVKIEFYEGKAKKVYREELVEKL
jgi:hypothetical protein